MVDIRVWNGVMLKLVHHGTILEMNVENYRRRSALDKSAKRPGPGRPAKFATEKNTARE